MINLLKLKIIKKFLTTSLFILLFVSAFAQQPAMKRIDSMLINIDKTHFTTNILYERTTPWSKLSIFNDSINISTKRHFEQALHELYKASNEQKFTYYRDLRNQYTSKTIRNTVDIGIINTTFNELNYEESDETKSALRIVNGKFEEIDNTIPVFKIKRALVISPLKEKLTGNTITYKFNNQFLFQETDKPIQTLVANFDTSQNYTIIENGTITTNSIAISYPQEGIKTLTFNVTFTDGTTSTTSAIVQVSMLQNDPSLVETDSIIATETFQGIKGEIEYRIFYRTKKEDGSENDETTLKKPIVIIDGFDPGDKRKIGYLEDAVTEKTLINQMWYDIDDGDNNPDNNIKVNVVNELREEAYDVVLVNQITHTKNNVEIDGGADYIERNAMAHIALYQHLNARVAESGSTEKLVIMGPSMGGQISRYALAYMEKHNIDHNTRLWVSVDSPHLGANISVGQQALIKFFADIEDQVQASDSYYNKLRSVAGQQQLIEQYGQLNNTNPLRQQYASNLTTNGLDNSNGYPINLRKVAMANGSLLSQNVGIAGEQDFRIHAFMRWLFWDAKVSEMNTRYMPNTGNTTGVMYIWRQFKPTHYYSLTNNNPNGSMDIVPGGLTYTQEATHAGITGTTPDIPSLNNGVSFGNALTEIGLFLFGFRGDFFGSRINKQKHSFVPTVSALGFTDANFNWSDDINRNLICTDEIPFDNYYAPQENTNHTSFTQESKDWLFQELDADPVTGPFPLPSVYLRVNELIGDAVICSNKTNTYSIDIPSSCIGSVNWTVSSNIEIISQTHNSITVIPSTTNLENAGFVSVSIPNLSFENTKGVWVGLPNNDRLTIQKIGSYNFYTGQWTKLKANYSVVVYDVNEPFSFTFEWQIPNSQVRNFSDSAYKDVKPYNSGQLNIGVKAINECGCGDWKYRLFDVLPITGGGVELVPIE